MVLAAYRPQPELNVRERMFNRISYGTSEAALDYVCTRIYELEEINSPFDNDRSKIKAIMNGGADAVSLLLGEKFTQSEIVDKMPIANHMVSASIALATKLGRIPDTKIDPPLGNDSDTARKKSEKRVRIAVNYDRASNLRMLLPQVGLWLPGYAFVPWVIKHKRDPLTGDPYPSVELRDPSTALPDEWSTGQQPKDICFRYRMGVKKLAEYIGEEKAKELMRTATDGVDGARTVDENYGTYYDLRNIGTGGGWGSQSNKGVPVYEFIDINGTWLIHIESRTILSFVPNPLKTRAPFYVSKKFSFDKLMGQYDHIIGLMAAIARLNLLLIIATEDAVHAETNVTGNVESNQGKYAKGRNVTNILSPGSSVNKMTNPIQFQLFQQAQRLEEQLRTVGGYPVTEDSVSPNSFVTGRGLEELQGSVNNRTKEYYLIIGDTLENITSMLFEWDDEAYGTIKKSMWGVNNSASFEDSYTPNKDIAGKYINRRVYGAMAAFDEPSKIITGLQLLSAEVIDLVTMRENVDGLENHTLIEQRLLWQKGVGLLEQMMMQRLQPGAEQLPPPDPKVMKVLLAWLPPGELRENFEDIFMAEEEEQLALPATTGPEQMSPLEAGTTDTQTVLARLLSGQEPQAGIQTVGSI